MNYYRKVLIDRVAGGPLIFLTNIVARIAGSILRRDHSLGSVPQKIIVCKLVGIGSIVQSTTLLVNLKRQFPGVKIIYLSTEANRTLLEKIPLIDGVIAFDDRSMSQLLLSAFKVAWQCWNFKADIFLDIEVYSNLTSFFSCVSMAKDRIGFYRKDQAKRLGIYTHMLYFNIKAPINQSYLQMGRLIGCVDTTSELYPIRINNDEKSVIEKSFHDRFMIEPLQYILVNPNASDLRIERRWPPERFTALINNLSKRYRKKFVLIGSLNERSYVRSVVESLDSSFSDRVINTAGMLSISELLCMIGNAEVMVTNDTGPMHLSFALGTKTLSLFGPCHPSQYGQLSNGIAIYKEVYCSPCVHEFLIPPCHGDNQCMKMISVDEVADAALELLDRPAEKNIPPGIRYLKSGTDIPLGLITRKKWIM